MNGQTSRLFGFVGLLLCVWIVVYWLYEPTRLPRVTLDPAPPLAATTIEQPPESLLPARVPALTGSSFSDRVPPPAAAETEPRPVELQKQTRVIPPQFREVLVQKGDNSWQKIAKRELGSASLWQAVARANPLLTSDRLKPGRTRVKIPLDPENTQGRLVEVLLPVEPDAGAPKELSPSAPPAKTYTISPNDSLWSISKKFYGRGAAWRTIYNANRNVISDPDRPPVGATIIIPDSPG